MAATAALQAPRKRPSAGWGNPLAYALALAVAGVSVAPVVYVILGGFRTTRQIAANPAGLPDPWVWTTYAKVITEARFWNQLLNSTLLAAGTTLGVVVLGVCAAFILARYQFRGREGIYTFFTVG